MTQPNSVSNSKIELDLEVQDTSQESNSRRSRPMVQEPQFSLPKIEPILGADDVGSDETEQTVGYFYLLSAVPGLIALFFGHGVGGLLNLVIPLYIGVGLLRGDDFVKQWVFAVCFVQLIVGPLSALVFPSSFLYILGGLAQSGGLLALVSGKALSKQMYRVAVGAVCIGTLIGIIGSLRA